jgi:ABC-type multidrug transport system ATPase subunit
VKVSELDYGVINILDKEIIRLGRIPEGNDLILPHPAVSSHHARLENKSDGFWWIFDHGSDLGTFLNNQRVSSEGLPVKPERDTIWIPPYALRLTDSIESSPPKRAHLHLDAVNLQRLVGSRILLDLQGTPLSFRPGEFVAIVGGSGAGKSTLMKSLLGMDTIPSRGRRGIIYFNNQILVKEAEVRSFAPVSTIVGYVPQQDDSLHFQLSAFEILNYTAQLRLASDLSPMERNERIIKALNAVKLDREELQQKPISSLSGGQRKRVNIAAELIAEPRVLFLDEPTSGLDPGLDLEMMNLMKNWAKGVDDQDPKTIVLITHATENVRLCDSVVFMGRVRIADQERGGCVLYFGPPGDTAQSFFGKDTFSEVYQQVDKPEVAGIYHAKLTTQPQWNHIIWDHSRTAQDIEESGYLEASQSTVVKEAVTISWMQYWRKFRIFSSRYLLLLRRDKGAFLFQVLQGILVSLLLWGVADRDAFTVGGVRSAPTTLFILSIAATWLGILNASKEIVKEKRIFGREHRYGGSSLPYVLSKLAVLGGLGIWQMLTLIAMTEFYFQPENHIGAFGNALPEALQGFIPLEFEWFITLELMLLSGISLGLFISSIARSLDQATMLMFPAMLIQILLAGLLFDVGPLSWISITHWGLQGLGNSLDLEGLFVAGGKAGDPILDKLNLTRNVVTLLGYWFILFTFIFFMTAVTCWRQSLSDKARIPEE